RRERIGRAAGRAVRLATTRRSPCGPRLNCGGDLGGSAHMRSAVVAAVGGVCGDVRLDSLPDLGDDLLGAAVGAHGIASGPLSEVHISAKPGTQAVQQPLGGNDVALVLLA